MGGSEDLVTICIFTPYGATFTFREATVITDNETMLVFSYKAMSDGRQKVGKFIKANIVGWSFS